MADQPSSILDMRVDGDILVLTITHSQLRSIEFEIVDSLRDDMLAAIEKHAVKKVVVDLSAVTQFGSASFRPLLSLRRHLTQINGQMILCGLKGEVREVFLVTRLIDEQGSSAAPFGTTDNVESALARLRK